MKKNSSEALARDGVIEIKGFLDANRATELRSTVNEIYDALSSAGDLGGGRLADSLRLWNGVSLEALPAYLSSYRADLAARYTSLLDDISNETRRTFGPKWKFLPERSFVRRHIGMTKQVPWHVDADAAGVARLANQCINVWIPLDDVGIDLPSLEIVGGSSEVMRKIPKLTGNHRYRDDNFVARIGGKPSTPILNLGDALIFDQYTLHRTQQVEGRDIVRTACEFRFAQNLTLVSAARRILTGLSAIR